MRTFYSALMVFGLIASVCLSQSSLSAQAQAKKDEALPGRTVVIDVNAPGRALYKIAVPMVQGDQQAGAEISEVLRNDLTLSSLFEVLNPKSYLADLKKEGLTIKHDAWNSVGAQAVVKGLVTVTGSQIALELRLFELGKGDQASLSREYKGPIENARLYAHQFSNQILKTLTGVEGHFDSRIVFAQRSAPGKKDVYVADYDGNGVSRVSSGRGVSMLPAFGPSGIWYSVLTRAGMYITRQGKNEYPIIHSAGLNMGVTACNGRLYFSSTRDGNSEIYSANAEGGDVRRLTQHRAIDVSPSCGPGGQIAFVSGRHGSPQIWVMGPNGENQRRVTYKGSYNQTPSWCPKADIPLIAFTGDVGGFDIFTVNVQTGEYKRLTQGQGANKDPAFSPDCRMIAFSSTRGGGGVYIMNPDGLNQQQVIRGAAETIRWSR